MEETAQSIRFRLPLIHRSRHVPTDLHLKKSSTAWCTKGNAMNINLTYIPDTSGTTQPSRAFSCIQWFQQKTKTKVRHRKHDSTPRANLITLHCFTMNDIHWFERKFKNTTLNTWNLVLARTSIYCLIHLKYYVIPHKAIISYHHKTRYRKPNIYTTI